jgi:hypothetical protein
VRREPAFVSSTIEACTRRRLADPDEAETEVQAAGIRAYAVIAFDLRSRRADTSDRPARGEWGADADRYRVYFWSRDGSRCEEHEVTDAPDVGTVLAWAEQKRGQRVLELFVVREDGGGLGLIRLQGGRPVV